MEIRSVTKVSKFNYVTTADYILDAHGASLLKEIDHEVQRQAELGWDLVSFSVVRGIGTSANIFYVFRQSDGE